MGLSPRMAGCREHDRWHTTAGTCECRCRSVAVDPCDRHGTHRGRSRTAATRTITHNRHRRQAPSSGGAFTWSSSAVSIGMCREAEKTAPGPSAPAKVVASPGCFRRLCVGLLEVRRSTNESEKVSRCRSSMGRRYRGGCTRSRARSGCGGARGRGRSLRPLRQCVRTGNRG